MTANGTAMINATATGTITDAPAPAAMSDADIVMVAATAIVTNAATMAHIATGTADVSVTDAVNAQEIPRPVRRRSGVMTCYAMRYTLAPASRLLAIGTPALLASVLRKPRTECRCQPVAAMIWSTVTPLSSSASTVAFLLTPTFAPVWPVSRCGAAAGVSACAAFQSRATAVLRFVNFFTGTTPANWFQTATNRESGHAAVTFASSFSLPKAGSLTESMVFFMTPRFITPRAATGKRKLHSQGATL